MKTVQQKMQNQRITNFEEVLYLHDPPRQGNNMAMACFDLVTPQNKWIANFDCGQQSKIRGGGEEKTFAEAKTIPVLHEFASQEAPTLQLM